MPFQIYKTFNFRKLIFLFYWFSCVYDIKHIKVYSFLKILYCEDLEINTYI